MSNETSSVCPVCGGLLDYRDSRSRIMKASGGISSWILIRRLKCGGCRKLHNELPDILTPYKHYASEIIEDVADGAVTADDLATEDYPCEATMERWKGWIDRNILRIDGMLKSVGYRLLDFSEQLLKSGISLLMELREAGAGWLGTVLRLIYNSGGFLPP